MVAQECEMLDSTSRITAICRERGIVVGLMTDGRFSGGSVGLVIGHVGPEAAMVVQSLLLRTETHRGHLIKTSSLPRMASSDLFEKRGRIGKSPLILSKLHPSLDLADTRLQ